MGHASEERMRMRFARWMNAKTQKDQHIEAGCEYVKGYVEYGRFVEGLHTGFRRI